MCRSLNPVRSRDAVGSRCYLAFYASTGPNIGTPIGRADLPMSAAQALEITALRERLFGDVESQGSGPGRLSQSGPPTGVQGRFA